MDILIVAASAIAILEAIYKRSRYWKYAVSIAAVAITVSFVGTYLSDRADKPTHGDDFAGFKIYIITAFIAVVLAVTALILAYYKKNK